MAPPPPATMPLTQRVMHLAQTLQYVLPDGDSEAGGVDSLIDLGGLSDI